MGKLVRVPWAGPRSEFTLCFDGALRIKCWYKDAVIWYEE